MANTATTASASRPKLLAGGLTFVTGIAILANPRMVPASKTIVLDVQLYLGPTDEDVLIGSLRYYNSTNSSFDDGPNLYFIYATFARRESKADVSVSENRSLLDYTFVGDIQRYVPLGPLRSHQESEGPNDLPTFTIDPREQPYIQVSGVATNCSKADATFEVTVEQYISCFRSNKDAGGGHSKPATTFFCHIPDSSIYRNWRSKPVPVNKRYVTLCGILTGVDRSDDGSGVENFRIEVHNIFFCGQYVPPAVPSMNQSSPVKSAGGAPTNAIFAYNPRRALLDGAGL